MEYVQPIGAAADASYVDANPAGGVEGSPVPAAAIEHPMREIVAVIEAAGLTPDGEDLTQLADAIAALIAAGTPAGVAYLAVSQVWTAQQSSSVAALVDAATVAWDLSVGQVAKVTLSGNRTLGAPTNQVDGTYYSLRITQDGTGSRTLAYNAAFKGVTGITLSTTAGAVDHLVFRSNGTNMELVSIARNVGA